MDPRERELWKSIADAAGLVGQLGASIAAPIVLCAVAGVYLDRWLGARGIATFGMIVLGLAAAGYSGYRMIAAVLRDKRGP
ncbi:MAG TPA: AtpZ/AtpI family protein [Candidatus Hydrogenedentes bacterium]|nr:AtpZ/AtpI family protein [Candidatus Hydrogenedentota bacterium]HOV74891.1 AtpZ/AtpI family protein [Candidatus Hydrogenedentota bacterium]HPC17547.1 AtpZ/AtpI family protein [Candidatus Hydrogenedentota bacterium]HRT20612.1 AtpZ/AtpI family protein [Candidatus Hydrogenedentota bacterium]HRT65381.1 AtpZ/AtpI family protein [Candidatus Hydrogenedentota bacterium]